MGKLKAISSYEIKLMSKLVLKTRFLISSPVSIAERQMIHSISEMTIEQDNYSKYNRGGKYVLLYFHSGK